MEHPSAELGPAATQVGGVIVVMLCLLLIIIFVVVITIILSLCPACIRGCVP